MEQNATLNHLTHIIAYLYIWIKNIHEIHTVLKYLSKRLKSVKINLCSFLNYIPIQGKNSKDFKNIIYYLNQSNLKITTV